MLAKEIKSSSSRIMLHLDDADQKLMPYSLTMQKIFENLLSRRQK